MPGEYQVDEHGLTIQDLKTLDVAKLTPTSREVISRQATINVGTIGHVAHGKKTNEMHLHSMQLAVHKDHGASAAIVLLQNYNTNLYYI